jgi:hypothetical protein
LTTVVVLRWQSSGGGARASWGRHVSVTVHPGPAAETWTIELAIGPPNGAQCLLVDRCNEKTLQAAKARAVDISTEWLRFYSQFWELEE